MNEPVSKKLAFNKSIFFSLKAELLKKQEEVKEKKRLPQHKIENFIPKNKTNVKYNKDDFSQNKRSLKDNLKAIDTDELEACRKSKLSLEKKAELYEHLSDATGNSQLADRFLVNFKEKKEQDTATVTDEDNVEEVAYGDESEWTEFTDFLGRTRKCLKTDLEYYKKRNQDLIKVVSDGKEEEITEKEEVTPKPEKPFLVQKTNDYLQSLREKWEQKEQEMLAKDKDIHYQDLLFDEARMHGVGYYSFSTDESERQKQMEELLKQRQHTLLAQQEAQEVRKKREDLMAARIAAARARQRIRAGLPPEDPEEKKKEFTTCLLKFLNEQKNAADSKAKEEEKKAKGELEKERQQLRDAYIREWDLGKEGVEGKVKKFREMSQEEYVEQQRAKRDDEFAPIRDKTIVSSTKTSYSYDAQGRKCDTNNPEKTWSDVRRMNTPSPPNISDLGEDTSKGLYFSTKKADKHVKYGNFVQPHKLDSMQNMENEIVLRNNEEHVANSQFNKQDKIPSSFIIGDLGEISTKKVEKVVKYRNFIKSQEPVLIQNELENVNDDFKNENSEERHPDEDHAEIEPPTTYDYYGPTPKHRKIQKPFDSDMNEAFAQGSKSLEPRDNSRKLPKTYDFTFD